jgi:RNA polymerase subunit RPABC4/transcription elongation factor Spt4
MTQPRSHFEEEMRIIPTGWVVTSIVSFAAIQVLFNVYVPSHHHDLPPQPWWALIGIVAGVVMAAMILLIGYVYADAKRRGMNAVLWTLLVILLPKLLGFVVYFMLRKPLLAPCPNCRWPIGSEFAYCPKCGFALAPACANCGRAIRRDYQCCPYCGKPVGATAT